MRGSACAIKKSVKCRGKAGGKAEKAIFGIFQKTSQIMHLDLFDRILFVSYGTVELHNLTHSDPHLVLGWMLGNGSDFRRKKIAENVHVFIKRAFRKRGEFLKSAGISLKY